MEIMIELCCSLECEHVYRSDLSPKASRREPAFHVSVSLDFSPSLIHKKNLCAVLICHSSCFNPCASAAPGFLSRSRSSDK